MEGLQNDQELMQALVRWTGLAPTQIAKKAGLAATTILRPYKGTAESRTSQPTLDKLRTQWPDFPGWRTEHPDQVGMLGYHPDPNERPGELVYVRQVDISYAMGGGAVIEDYPATGLIPFNLEFLRAISRANVESLFLASGIGDSMEPTLLRNDLLMIDTSQRQIVQSDLVWAFNYAGGGMVKRLRRVRRDGADRLLIISDNQSVPDEIADPDDVHITGKVIWAGRRLV